MYYVLHKATKKTIWKPANQTDHGECIVEWENNNNNYFQLIYGYVSKSDNELYGSFIRWYLWQKCQKNNQKRGSNEKTHFSANPPKQALEGRIQHIMLGRKAELMKKLKYVSYHHYSVLFMCFFAFALEFPYFFCNIIGC